MSDFSVAEDTHGDNARLVVKEKRRSRENTVEEKKRMRRMRKKRLRKCKTRCSKAKLDLKNEVILRENAQQESVKYRAMSRTFWERWRWELQKRKEAMVRELQVHRHQFHLNRTVTEVKLQHIDPDMLTDPVIDKVQREEYVGRGSFGVVKMQLYRGITVAVKEFLPRTVADDVVHEASMLASLCHPYLPLLFGVCLNSKPYHKIVMQFHAYALGSNKAVTMEQRLLQDDKFKDRINWLILCGQLLEAVSYLHDETNVLHNDIKVSNILIATNQENCQVVLIDFGKATFITAAKRYSLSEFEKREYIRKYPHIAPEIIEGETKQSVQGDMFAIGLVIHKMIDKNCYKGLPQASQIKP